MKVLSANQIYQSDQATILNEQISSIDLMERAGEACFEWICNYIENKNQKIQIFCGLGNNGGDGLVIARKLIQKNYKINTYVVNFKKQRSDAFIFNLKRLQDIEATVFEISNIEDFPSIQKGEIVIDAIFGIGLSRPIEGLSYHLICHINNFEVTTISIDIPSGLYADSNVTNRKSVIVASEVLTFQNPKLAFLIPDNQLFIKNWQIIKIGLNQNFIDNLESRYETIDEIFIKSIYKKRNKFSHKGSFGHCIIIGGSFGKIGAVVLAAKAALKIGSGLVTAYIPKCGYTVLQTTVPEAMVEVDALEELQYFNYKSIPSVIGIGMGMGTSDKTCKGFYKFIKNSHLPMVIDADGLNALAKHPKYLDLIPKDSILTPHPKEFERLVGKWKSDFDKLDKLMAFSARYHCIIVLKGTYSAISYQGKIFFNTSGNAALATAGSGDVLTGIITGLLAQKYSPIHASIFGVYLHGKAADIAISNDQSMETFMASDCIENFYKVFREL